MRKILAFIAALAIYPTLAGAQILRFVDLNTRDFSKLNRNTTVVIIILEEHGP